MPMYSCAGTRDYITALFTVQIPHLSTLLLQLQKGLCSQNIAHACRRNGLAL
jgi:hypothetical protein